VHDTPQHCGEHALAGLWPGQSEPQPQQDNFRQLQLLATRLALRGLLTAQPQELATLSQTGLIPERLAFPPTSHLRGLFQLRLLKRQQQ
jgi:hypothetical protein